MQENIILGKFNGENMLGDNDRIYPIPPNYASKSGLVEGDELKLIITEDGSFIFKQIGPVPRKMLRAIYVGDDMVKATNKKIYKVIHSSITYFKLAGFEEVVIDIPAKGKPKYAALKRVIHFDGNN